MKLSLIKMAQIPLNRLVTQFREDTYDTQRAATDSVFGTGNVDYVDRFRRLVDGINNAAQDGTLADRIPNLLQGLELEVGEVPRNGSIAVSESRYAELGDILKQSNYPILANFFPAGHDVNRRNEMKLATLVVLAKHKKPLTVREIRKNIKKLLPDYDAKSRLDQDLVNDSARSLMKTGLLGSRFKKGSRKERLYFIPDKLYGKGGKK